MSGMQRRDEGKGDGGCVWRSTALNTVCDGGLQDKKKAMRVTPRGSRRSLHQSQITEMAGAAAIYECHPNATGGRMGPCFKTR